MRKIKRIGYIYDNICDIGNIKLAIIKASKKKRKQQRVQRVLRNIDKVARQVQKLLVTKTYQPSPYIIKTIKDGANKKERVIHKPRFYPDQIIHWALMLQIEPIIRRGMYYYSCGSIPKRGPARGRKALRRWLDQDYKSTKYCLKMDVEKFYPSVDNGTLKAMLRRIIKDPGCLWLIDIIIDSARGLPIGNYTSQWFANFYLQGLDYFIKQELGVKYYIRYIDDLVLLGPNKKKLHKARRAIAAYLATIKLRLKGDWQVFRINDRGIDVLGFRFFSDHATLRRRNARRIRRRAARIGKKGRLSRRDASAIISYWGWIKHSNSYEFYNKYVRPCASVGRARRVVSWHARNHC